MGAALAVAFGWMALVRKLKVEKAWVGLTGIGAHAPKYLHLWWWYWRVHPKGKR